MDLNNQAVDENNKATKTCFVIMPISEPEGCYDSGHFMQVYQQLIKPACNKAGFKSIRADEVVKSNYIEIDILKKIITSDMVICDLSNNNPNVLYELGVRHAMKRPAVLIKDKKTQRIFDIQGIRCVEYNSSLRGDLLPKDKKELTNTIIQTYNGHIQEEDYNSLLQLIYNVKDELPKSHQLHQELKNELSEIKRLTDDVLNKVNEIYSKTNDYNSSRVESSVQADQEKNQDRDQYQGQNDQGQQDEEYNDVNGENIKVGDIIYFNGINIGTLHSADMVSVTIIDCNGNISKIHVTDDSYRSLSKTILRFNPSLIIDSSSIRNEFYHNYDDPFSPFGDVGA